MRRTQPLVQGSVYHITSKSIAGYRIFHSKNDYIRMIRMLRFFSYGGNLPKFSQFLNSASVDKLGFEKSLLRIVDEKEKLIQVVAYCLMPTHFHFILKQCESDGISRAVGNILNSFARYFNTKRRRHGPLWAGKFKNILVNSDEQLLHLTRYVHLNPVTAGIVDDAEQWDYSSHAEYVARQTISYPICEYRDLIDLSPSAYRRFVNDRADYQRQLAKIKKLTLEK